MTAISSLCKCTICTRMKISKNASRNAVNELLMFTTTLWWYAFLFMWESVCIQSDLKCTITYLRKPGGASPYEKTLSFIRDSRLNFYENPKKVHIFRASFVEMIWNYHIYSDNFHEMTEDFATIYFLEFQNLMSFREEFSLINVIISYNFNKNCSEYMEVLGFFVKIKSRIANKR